MQLKLLFFIKLFCFYQNPMSCLILFMCGAFPLEIICSSLYENSFLIKKTFFSLAIFRNRHIFSQKTKKRRSLFREFAIEHRQVELSGGL